MKVFRLNPIRPAPGQYVVAWRGRAEVLLITRKLPKRYFFREMRNGVSCENFVEGSEILFMGSREAAERRARAINFDLDDYAEHVRLARQELSLRLEQHALRFEL